jgi:pimeloyl-ACP methyl ester carboxylesterase
VSLSAASTDGVTLALHDLGGSGPTLLMAHPTGFHGMIWAPVAAHLRDVAHCWALDFRGHGDSTVPASGSFGWQGEADDVLAVVDQLRRHRPHEAELGLYGVGHSMGGAALVLAEQAAPGTWQALWCFEPIVFPPFEGEMPSENPLATAARRRTAVFPSRDAALANYASKPPLGRLHPDALEAYVEYGFRDRADGSVELKCAPETEAAVFGQGHKTDAFGRLGRVACPVTVCGSGDGAPPAKMAQLIADALPHGRLEQFPHLSHFGPMEHPSEIAASIRQMLPAGH